ncbi:hypothetical protein [Peribacillus aracenensis]|uniref:hypothetical protein n=1 Tax=Peribacillus aracenensis TaxID=2976708 RepID=UPI0028834303|nr:hypothetical protein [Peribacillus sp. BBB004]
MAEQEPLLLSFDQNGGANGLGDDPMDLEQYLLLFQLLSSSMQPILDHLTNQQSERVGVYDEANRCTFKQLLEFRVEHVRGHLAQIEREREAYRQRNV